MIDALSPFSPAKNGVQSTLSPLDDKFTMREPARQSSALTNTATFLAIRWGYTRSSLPKCGSGSASTACGPCWSLYMSKGFLGYDDTSANAVYGAYTALVYMTPFLGGMLADRLLGQRRAVIFGGTLMAAGDLLMMVPQTVTFFTPWRC